MFSRRRRGSSANPPVDRSTSQNAAAAATSAFLQKSQSTTSLSSAAAAAALRSQTTTPEPVGSIQTKRMVRRGSTSSNGSGIGMRGGGRGGLQRTNSNGSMSQRTFRSPSPGRMNGVASPRSPSPTAPPVPAIPKDAHKRAASVEAPQRVVSPTPTGTRRTASMDTTQRLSVNTGSQQVNRLGAVAETEDISPSSPSRNFSRPMSPSPDPTTNTASAANRFTHKSGSWHKGAVAPARPATSQGLRSPPAPINTGNSPTVDDSVMVYDPASRTFVSQSRALANGGSPTSPTIKPSQVYDPNTRTFVPAPPSPVATRAELPAAVPEPTVKKTRPVPPAVDTSMEPPPRNPARLSPTTSSPRSPRAAGVLNKQPSIVREDPEGEELAEAAAGTTMVSATSQAATTPAKSYASPAKQHQRSSSLDVPRRGGASGRGRNTSTSPQRSAHFSAAPVLHSDPHEPPPRNASPAKSALKYSPASSVRTTSPVAVFSPSALGGSPPSETSEDTQSQDGLGSGKKKKSFRVSFDEQPKEIEVAPVTPAPVPVFDDDDDAIMRPRPALPSFGSVRQNRVQAEPAQKVTEVPPARHGTSSDHAIAGILRNNAEPVPPEVTSKEAPGYVSDESSDGELPAVAAVVPESATPGVEPATVTNASGSTVRGFATVTPSKVDEQPVVASDLNVPDIQLQPPTPGIEDETKMPLGEEPADSARSDLHRNSMEHIVMPGSWAEEPESDNKEVAEGASAQESAITTAPDTVAGTVEPAKANELRPQELSDIDEDTDDAEFSDAMEDQSDDEDHGGFASLNAIVESPMVSPSSAGTVVRSAPAEEVPESPSLKQAAKQASRTGDATTTDSADWSEATAYWSQLTKEKKQEIEEQHVPPTETAAAAPAPRKSALKKTTPAAVAVTPVVGGTQPVIRSASASAAQPALRRTMRGQQSQSSSPVDDGAVHLRSSMRAGGQTTTSRARPTTPQQRPQSEYIEPRGALQKKHIRNASDAGSAATARPGLPKRMSSSDAPNQSSAYPTLSGNRASTSSRQDPPAVSERLQRELSNDSDSESSFKKKRKGRSTVDSQGRYSMRRSMRSGSVESAAGPPESVRPTSPPTTSRSKAFSLRSLSPNRSMFASKRTEPAPPLATTARTTLRGPPASRSTARTTMRATSAPPAKAAPAQKSRFKSRFADSDDSDDERRARTFRSRFADSDDDDDEPGFIATDLRPVRGIPRKQGQDDGDSTDLEDEEADEVKPMPWKRDKIKVPIVPAPSDVDKAMAAARQNLGISETPVKHESHEGEALKKGTLRPQPANGGPTSPASPSAVPFEAQDKKRRGFMGSILRRNRHSSASVQLAASASPSSPPPPMAQSPMVASPAAPGTPTDQATATMSPTASPSSRAKLVRRTSQPPQLKRGDSNYSTATAPVFSSAPRNDSESWPLPPPIPDNTTTAPPVTAERPNTSDGVSPEAIKLAQSMRPDLAPRSFTGQQIGSGPRVRIQAGEEGSEPGERSPGAVYSRRTGRKKKFGMLRRALGIND